MDDSKKVITYFKLDKQYIEELKSIFGISSQSDYKYEYIDKRSVEITRYTGKGGDVVIPDTIGDNLKVVRIGKSAFAGCVGLTSVTIPDTVTEIGEMAFSNCTNMAAITIASSVARIESFAFAGCVKIVMIILPKSLTYLGDEPFVGCTNLRIIDVDPDNKAFGSINGILFSKNMDTLLLCPQGYMGEYYIPDCVVSVNRSAFIRCKSVTGITIPDSVVRIGSYAFAECVNLKRVTIPDSVTDIGENVFINCTGLTELNVPKSISGKLDVGRDILFVRENKQDDKISTTVPEPVIAVNNDLAEENKTPDPKNEIADLTEDDFLKYSGIEETPGEEFDYTIKKDGTVEIIRYNGKRETVVFPCMLSDRRVSSIKLINGGSDMSTVVKNVYLPGSITEISDEAFIKCSSIEKVVVQFKVRRIGDRAFSNCERLEKIEIPEGVLEIGDEAFAGCISLQEAVIPKGVKKIGNNAFSFCVSLTEVNLPNSVESIGLFAFSDCENLERVTIPDSVVNVGKDVFLNCSELQVLSVPQSLFGHFDVSSSIISFRDYDYNDEISEVSDRNDNPIKGKRTPEYRNGINDSIQNGIPEYSNMEVTPENEFEYTVNEDGTVYITGYTGNKETIVFPRKIANKRVSSVMMIYGNRSLTKSVKVVYLPDSITEIEEGAFNYCSRLEKVVIPSSVRKIGNRAFIGCTRLRKVVIPEGVSKIGSDAFYQCKSLVNVKIPGSVRSIGESAFYECKNLETVILSEGLESIDDFAFSDTKISRIFIPKSVTFIGGRVFYKGLFGGKTKIVGVKGSCAEKYTLRESGLSFEEFK